MTTPATASAQGNARPHPRASGSAPQFVRKALPVAVGFATILLVFVLPFLFPGSPVHGISASYLAGFNNSVAVLAAAGISVAVFLGTLLMERNQPHTPALPASSGQLGWRYITAVILASSLILSFAGTLVVLAHQRYLGDAGYIIEQASTWSETGRHLYTEIEFAYGPLLLFPEIVLHRLTGLDMTRAYFVILVLESALGLGMVAFLLNELPIRQRIRQAAFLLLTLGAITPHLGLNYTFFRFASPLFLFFLAAKRATTPVGTALLLSAAVVVECAISPELAFALALGVIAYAGVRTWQNGRAWLLCAAVPLTLLALLIVSIGQSYLRMVSTFAAGVYNLPVGPYPHIVILLIGLVWLVPVYLGRSVSVSSPSGARTLGLYTVALAMVPAALRRCDPLHVFFNGIGVLLLSLAAVSVLSRKARILWVGCLAVLVLWEHRVNETLFSWRTAFTVRQALLPHTPVPLRPVVVALASLPDRNVKSVLLHPPEPEQVPDLAAVYHRTGDEPIAIPFEIPPDMEAALKRAHRFEPLFHAFGVDMMDSVSEQNALTELDKFHWLLLPSQLQLSAYQQVPENLGPLQGMRMYFHTRRPAVFVPGAIFESGIASSWIPVQTFGQYTLYRSSRLGEHAAQFSPEHPLRR